MNLSLLKCRSQEKETQLVTWLQKQTWFVYDNDQADIKKFWETNFNKSAKIIPRYILPSYINIVEALKNNSGFSIVPKQYCEDYLKENLIKLPFISTKLIEQNLFYSYKLKNRNLNEINQFMDEFKKTTSANEC